MSLIIRDARNLRGERIDIAIENAKIGAVEAHVGRRGTEFDAGGATVLPGLHDHHLHILATAAHRHSIDLAACRDLVQVRGAITRAARAAPRGSWLRATGYDERAGGLPARADLDAWAPHHRLRLQDRTGALWVLNSRALQSLPNNGEWPSGAERHGDGSPTGRFWREDSWLREHLPRSELQLDSLGAEFAAFGLTGLTDAGAGNGPEAAATLAGAMPQRLTIMGDETLERGRGYRLGPLKMLIDERDPPAPEAVANRIATARGQWRNVAAHCVTAAELALFLAALELAGGARVGDRIEHGGMIGDAAIVAIAVTPLTVVTNPGFVRDRGDRYRAMIAPGDWPDLYRAASLRAAGIPLAAGSDAPYASADPWRAMRAARDRLTASGDPLGLGERLDASAALKLYLGQPNCPGGISRTIAPGQPADLILCDGPWEAISADLSADRVRATVIAGDIVFSRA